MDSESTTRDHPDFAPMVVGHTDSHRARVASAHDETREEPGPGLRQEAQIVLACKRMQINETHVHTPADTLQLLHQAVPGIRHASASGAGTVLQCYCVAVSRDWILSCRQC